VALLSLACGSDGDPIGGNASGNGNADCNELADQDGDGLDDCREREFGTNVRVADTDGDGFLDGEEVENWDRGGGNHLRFNPLVADVPRLFMRQLGTPVIQLYAQTEESGTVTRGMSEDNSSEVQTTTSRGRTNVHRVEEQHTVNVNAEVQKRGPLKSGRVEAEYGYSHNDTTTDTSYWNEMTVRTNRQASEQYFETIESETTITTGGEIKVLLGLANDGDVSYTVNNMEVAAFMEDPRRPEELIPIGTLRHEGQLSFTPDPLGPGADLATADLTPFNFVYRAEGNPQEIARVLENSDRLVLQPTNLSITGQRPDVDLNLAAQNVRARTAEVIIDFGSLSSRSVERYRVAIDQDGNDDIGFEALMEDRLNASYAFGQGEFADGSTGRGLLSIRDRSMNAQTRSYWLVAHTFTPVDAPAGTRTTEIYNLLREDYEEGDIRLGRSDVLHMVYVTDSDLDGLSDRIEQLNGTDLGNPDTDGDTLDDALETYGWFTNLGSPPCDQGENLVLVFSNPRVADSDGDGIDDAAEFASCTNPEGDLQVTAGEDRVVAAGRTLTLRAAVRNAIDPDAIRITWMQTAGPSVGPLPREARIDLSLPDQVTALEFEVVASDGSQDGLVATDTMRILAVPDPSKARFVDPDEGLDGENPGTPEAPIRTFARAFELAATEGTTDIFLKIPEEGGVYRFDETIDLPEGVNLYGGWGRDWLRDGEAASTPIQIDAAVGLQSGRTTAVRADPLVLSGLSIRATDTSDPEEDGMAVQVVGAPRVLLDRVWLQGPDRLTPADLPDGDRADFDAGSSFGFRGLSVGRLEVVGSTLAAGRGADGVAGLQGARGPDGDNGNPGNGRGGGAGGSDRTAGANGGRGGTAPTGAASAGCTPGNSGAAGGNNGSIRGGAGGAAGSARIVDVVFCETRSGGNGSPGDPGRDGAPGDAAGLPTGFSPSGQFLPEHGSAGRGGSSGAGGGGGGSGPSFNFNDGGGGGGGGEGGGAGAGGGGGRGAGGSFAVVVASTPFVFIESSALISSDGGA